MSLTSVAAELSNHYIIAFDCSIGSRYPYYESKDILKVLDETLSDNQFDYGYDYIRDEKHISEEEQIRRHGTKYYEFSYSSGYVGTDTKVLIYKGEEAVKSIPVVIKGDPSGDGKLSSVDVLYAQRHIVKTYTLGDSYFKAADINGDGKITSVDTLYMQRDIVGTYTIEN